MFLDEQVNGDVRSVLGSTLFKLRHCDPNPAPCNVNTAQTCLSLASGITSHHSILFKAQADRSNIPPRARPQSVFSSPLLRSSSSSSSAPLFRYNNTRGQLRRRNNTPCLEEEAQDAQTENKQIPNAPKRRSDDILTVQGRRTRPRYPMPDKKLIHMSHVHSILLLPRIILCPSWSSSTSVHGYSHSHNPQPGQSNPPKPPYIPIPLTSPT